MSDFLSDGYNLNDYVSDGQMFYKPTDKIRFEGALSALCDSRRHVMIVTDDTKLAERYYRYFITRIAIRRDIVLDTRAPTGADDVLNRFNKILSNASIESARSEDASDLTHVMAMVDTSNMSNNEWVVLGRLLKNFPGANIRMLAFVSEDQLEVIDEVLGKLDGQVYRWILTSPTAEYLEALLDIGEQFNYQAETRAMASALGYNSKRFQVQTEEDPLDALDEIDRHLTAMTTPSAEVPANNDIGRTTESSREQSNGDFDNDLKALLGAVRNLSTEETPDSTDTRDSVTQTDASPKQDASNKSDQPPLPPRRLIWATAVAGISLIALAIFAPWESEQVDVGDVSTTISSRVFVDDPSAQEALPNPNITRSSTNKTTEDPSLAPTSSDTTASNDKTLTLVSQPEIVADESSARVQPEATSEPALETDERGVQTHLAARSKPDPVSEESEGDSQEITTVESELAAEVPEVARQLIATTQPEFTSDVTEVETHTFATSESNFAAQEPDVETPPLAELEPESVFAEPRVETLRLAESELEPAFVEPQVETSPAAEPKSELTAEELEVETKPVSQAPRDRINKAEPNSFFIQLGVYANQTQAQALVDDLAASEPVFFLPLQKGSRILQTVMSGPYPDRESAEQAARTRFSSSDTWVRSVNAISKELID
jgi:cell division septation protein DedD